MEPKKIPARLIEQGVGQPMRFEPPDEMPHIGDLEMLVLAHPEQLRAVLQDRPPPFPPGSRDLWICWFQPSELEVEHIRKGAPIRISFVGMTSVHPMIVDTGYNLEGSPFGNSDRFDGHGHQQGEN